ncbi:flagellar assembly protein FliX [Terrarubrum flagellatum]|uniref:flagellar assembly protein FliX n=1 Tax=Terrirubrum flagellatum TaxID=2895980 RepID=UPI003145370A
MRVEPRSPVAAGAVNRTRAAAGSRFSLDAEKTGSASSTTATGSMIGLDAVLALQADVEDAPQRRRKAAAKRGHDILDALEQLKIALLTGRVSADQIARLKREIALAGGKSGDPQLDDLIAHIELRAEVELAKLAR